MKESKGTTSKAFMLVLKKINEDLEGVTKFIFFEWLSVSELLTEFDHQSV